MLFRPVVPAWNSTSTSTCSGTITNNNGLCMWLCV